MPSRRLRLALSVFAVALVSFAASSALAASPAYPTSDLALKGLKQTTVGGYTGVLANYTSSFAYAFTGFVYLDLTNAAGQTVYLAVGTCSFEQGALSQCFVPMATTLSSGTYTAHVFVTTSTDIAISITGALNVVL
jgi:hypothetical protein